MIRRKILSFIPALCLVPATAPAVLAGDAAPIVVSSPWLRATPKGAPVAGGYATITNKGTEPDRLVGATLAIAPAGEVHSMRMANGVMHMERLADGVPIAPGATIKLMPGGNHLMFMKPTAQLRQGETVQGTLTFAKAGAVAVAFSVAGMAASTAPGEAAAHAGMDMNGMDMNGMDMKGMR